MENSTTTDRLEVLFVTWQDPDSKTYFPIGRLIRRTAPSDLPYEFCYLNGLNGAKDAGFSSFLAFPEPEKVYFSNDLFPLFANRLMARSRPDFAKYAQRLDLDPEAADDFEILARSGGRRMTDSFELFTMPERDERGCYLTYFLAHGIRHLSDDSHKRIRKLKSGDQLFVAADFQNPYDTTALALRTTDCTFVGFLPRYLLQDAWELQEACGYIEVYVEQMNLPPAPIQHWLLCRMESCWPEDFVPYCSKLFKPIADDATLLPCPE